MLCANAILYLLGVHPNAKVRLSGWTISTGIVLFKCQYTLSYVSSISVRNVMFIRDFIFTVIKYKRNGYIKILQIRALTPV